MKTMNMQWGIGLLLLMALMATAAAPALADNSNPPKGGKISGRSVAAGVLSFLIWPGIGQAVNSSPGDKVATHAVLGLVPLTRFWSGYDALVDRKGGYWNGKI